MGADPTGSPQQTQAKTRARMEFSEVIAKRRSVRHFNAEARRRRTRTSCAARRGAAAAPTAGNIQPWRFVVLREPRGARAARRRPASDVGDRGAGRDRGLCRPSAVRRALRRPGRAALRDPGHRGGRREHPAGGGRPGPGVVLDRRVRRACGERRDRRIARPIDARRHPADRLLGGIGRKARAQAA